MPWQVSGATRSGLATAAAHRRSVRADRPAGGIAGAGSRHVDRRQCRAVFPTSDDQQAGLVGGGAVDAGQMAIILGTSAVVNSSSAQLAGHGRPRRDAAQLGPVPVDALLQQRRQFLNEVVGDDPDWAALEAAARDVEPGARGTMVLPFLCFRAFAGRRAPAVSLGAQGAPAPRQAIPRRPGSAGLPDRPGRPAARGGRAEITRITVSGGIAAQRPHVRNPGHGAGQAARSAAIQ